MHVVLAERSVVERVRCVPRLVEVPLGERVAVDDQRAALGEVLEVRLQRGRVHRDEDVRTVTGREDVVVREVQLEAAHAGQGAGWSADLGGKIRERRQVIPEDRGLLGEPVPRELHTVTRVAGEPDDDVIELLDLLGHSWKTSSARRGRALSWHHPTAGGMS